MGAEETRHRAVGDRVGRTSASEELRFSTRPIKLSRDVLVVPGRGLPVELLGGTQVGVDEDPLVLELLDRVALCLGGSARGSQELLERILPTNSRYMPGVRYGQAAALGRGRYNLLRRRLIISGSMGEVKGTVVFGLPKNGRQRTVVDPKFVCDGLEAHLETFVGPGNDALVFTSSEGKPLRYSNFRSRYSFPALLKAGLDKPFGLHALRLRVVNSVTTTR